MTLIFIDPFVSKERLIYTAKEMQYTEIHTYSVSNYSDASKRSNISFMSLTIKINIPYVNKCQICMHDR